MPSPEKVVSQMRQRLRLIEPDLDTSIGTPVRKILDVVGEAVAEASVDNYLLTYQYDIDAKTGADLDDFVRLFGFTRLPARRATGTITFERSTPATQTFVVPVNTQISTDNSPQVIVSTVTPAVLGVGDTSITVPAQALVAGSGSNVPANTLRRPLANVQGVATVTNEIPFSGGIDAESDSALRKRFKETIFRSLAGTESMYRGTALEHPSVIQASVVSAARRFTEQIELVGGTGTSTINDARYIYPQSSALGPDITAGDIFVEGVHYEFDHEANPPTITSLSSEIVPDGVYELEFDYTSSASRNSPPDNVTNRVDIWVQGQRITEAVETAIFDHSRLFTATEGPYQATKFQRDDETNPLVGNFFIPFGFGPVIDPAPLNGEIEINGLTYQQDVHFWLVRDVTERGGSNRSLSGIEFLSVDNGLADVQPADKQHFQVTYLFNSVPRDIEIALQRWRLVTQDVWVHEARENRLNFHLAAIFIPGFDPASVRPAMLEALRDLVNSVGFNGTLQTSDVLAAAHAVEGIDAVRFLTGDEDPVHYAIQRVDLTGAVQETYATGGRARDVFTTDDTVVVVNDVTITPKAPNTFGTV